MYCKKKIVKIIIGFWAQFVFLPGVNVAPPGNEERVGGIAFTLALAFPLTLGCLI